MQPADVNAVTWAIFPGQEVVQSTIIEEVSFLSWKVCSPSLRLLPNLCSFRAPANPSASLLLCSLRSTGRSLLDLARLGVPLPSNFADSQAARGHSGLVLAR
jgi:hypothetical protein